jgi:hypothetical protein
MSKQTQEDFERLVNHYFKLYEGALNLSAPLFRCKGFVTTATMSGVRGSVEILCGPAEYHAELFIESSEIGQRWNLADLMKFDPVRKWLLDYSKKDSSKKKSGLSADVEWIFLILLDGLKEVQEFSWITSVVGSGEFD